MEDVFNKMVEEAVKEHQEQESKKDKTYEFEFDILQMYYGVDYEVNEQIKIHIPTIGEIIEFGEKKVYSSIMPFVGNPTSYRLQLWDMGIDWNKISDYELFVMLSQGLQNEDTKLLFGELDFSTLKPYINQSNEEVVLCNDDQSLIITEELYVHMREYIRLMFDQHPKVEKAKGKSTKQSIIDEERMNLISSQRESEKNKYKSIYLPLISSLLNHPGFKYKKNELKDVTIVEFMDSVKRLQVYESTRALMSGMYSGMIDTSGIDKKEFNWLRDLYE